MYAETDFLLALVKPDDWLGQRAAALYREYSAVLWTSELTLIELLLVAYREDRDAELVIANVRELVDVEGDGDTVLAAASYVEEHGFTPFDALHLVRSNGDVIVSSDEAYDDFAPRLALEEGGEE